MLTPILIGAAIGAGLGLALSLWVRLSGSRSLAAAVPMMVMLGFTVGGAAGMILPPAGLWPTVLDPGGARVICVDSEAEFRRIIRESEVPVLVDFGATWCPPCRQMDRILPRYARSRGDTVRVVKVDVDELPSLARSHGIRSIPALFVYQSGRLVAHDVGGRTERGLDALVNQAN
ncbi:thioredoxin family protein [Candidatus Sumerlaeota bacterium]|nr:thioredoxin family protein [Candidatus Sumerlaeota bacterium]